ncbi:MAG: PP2C family protein-serine/threonine phosphatase [Candidatus Aquicultorales bacterium]
MNTLTTTSENKNKRPSDFCDKTAIDALEASERRFRSIFETAKDAIVLADDKGDIIQWNQTAEDLFGYEAADVVGKPLTVLMPKRYRQAHREGIGRVVSGGVSHIIGKTIEVSGLNRSGEEFPIELSLAMWEGAGGVYFTGIIRDITERKRAEEALKKAYETERRIAHTLQESLIQPVPVIDGIEIGVAYGSAYETARVGGDFYDIFELEKGNILVALGDVSGKSIGSATMTATVRSTLRAVAYSNVSPAAVLSRANESILRQVPPDSFITAVVLLLDVEDGTFLYSSAGHPPPVICGSSCEHLALSQGVPLGSFMFDYENKLGAIDTGEFLVLYTDGLIEARRGNEFFGYERLLEGIEGLRNRNCQDIADLLLNGARDFAGGRLIDDVAIAVIKRTE